MNLLFFIIFLLFSLLVLRLGVVQIVKGEDYKREVERTDDTIVKTAVPRGEIFDRTGKLVVGNTPLNAITYTRPKLIKPEEMLKIAENLAKLIDIETDRITDSDKRDYWLLKNSDEAEKKISKKELAKLKDKELTDGEIYKIRKKRVTKEELDSLTDKDMKILAIYREFNSGYPLTPHIVKNNNVTEKEFATVSEQLDKLAGVDTATDWKRYYPFGSTLKTILGKVTSSEEGLPAELVDYYLAHDYNRNDRVGKSYLEYEYESVLHGEKKKLKNVTDNAGNIVNSEVLNEGNKGKDLVLTIDMELQKEVEKIIEKELRAAKSRGGTGLLDRAFVVLLEPYTGEVLTLAGKQYVNGKVEDFALGTFTTSYAMGSSVKGATVLTGFMTDAINPGQYFVDEPLKILGTPTKSSHFNRSGRVNMNDISALKRSSNVYMFKTAIEIGQGSYRYNRSLKLKDETFKIMREHFNQFGLGTRTGLDLPGEQVGFKGPNQPTGKALDFAIGQYDSYTPLQLAQYVATIANGGNRMKTHIVKEIREPSHSKDELGPVVQDISPKVLNRLDVEDEWLERVQKGFYQVVNAPDGTGYNAGYRSLPVKVAGKTGTAQAFYDGPKKESSMVQTTNQTFVAYAPYEKPEVAMAVVVPWAYQGTAKHSMQHNIGRQTLEAFFKQKQQRAKKGLDNATVEQSVENIDEAEEEQVDSRNQEEE